MPPADVARQRTPRSCLIAPTRLIARCPLHLPPRTQAVVVTVMAVSRLRSSSEQELILVCLFGWPKWMLRVVVGLELVAAAALIAAPQWGFLALGLVASGAVFVHVFRQKQPLAALPALCFLLLAVAGHSWTLDEDDALFTTAYLMGTAAACGAAGSALVGSMVGFQPSPDSLRRVLTASLEASAIAKKSRQDVKHSRKAFHKSAKQL